MAHAYHLKYLLAQRFPCNSFADPVKSLSTPSVPYFMTAPLKSRLKAILDSVQHEDIPTFSIGTSQLKLPAFVRSLVYLQYAFHIFIYAIYFFQNLKNIIFGSSIMSFNPEWRNQSFSFCDISDLKYGIVQTKVSIH